MATPKKDEILEAIANMTVLEVSELVKAMEEKFGVSAAVPVAVAAPPAAAGGEAAAEAEEQTEFTVVLKSFEDGKKIPVIKEVRALTGLGLKEAKELVEAGDKAVKEDISKESKSGWSQQALRLRLHNRNFAPQSHKLKNTTGGVHPPVVSSSTNSLREGTWFLR